MPGLALKAVRLVSLVCIKDAPAKNIFLQAVLSFKLKVLSKINELQSLVFALNFVFRLFAVASVNLLFFMRNFQFLDNYRLNRNNHHQLREF